MWLASFYGRALGLAFTMNHPIHASSPDWRVSFSIRWLLLAAALVPLAFIGWISIVTYRDAPFWDEFSTTLSFLVQLHDSRSWREVIGLFVAADGQHCMVTSRAIFAAIYLLTGKINFITLAAIGNVAIVLGVAILAWQPREVNLRLLYLAFLSLLIFQLQHFENQLLSYAAIDHYLVIPLAAGSLVLWQRGTHWAAVGAVVLGLAAVFTAAQGLAVFLAGFSLLGWQRRWRMAWLWAGLALGVAGFFVQTVDLGSTSGFRLTSLAAAAAALRYWLTLLGSVPGLEHGVLSPGFGLLGLASLVFLFYHGATQREPVLGAFLIFVLGATALIAYGRFTLAPPQIAPRYFIQSAIFWATLGVLIIEMKVAPARFWRMCLPVIGLVGIFNIVASQRYLPVAERFFRQRLEAIHYYDKWLTLAGAPHALHPDPALADRVLKAAEQRGIFRLQARSSPPIPQRRPAQEMAMDYHLDEISLGNGRIHIRGWVLPRGPWKDEYRPHLVFKAGDREFVFRGRRERRLDVAELYKRPEAEEAGFLFVIRRVELPPTELQVSLELRSTKQAIFTHTDHRINNQENFNPAPLAALPPSLWKPSRQIFIGVLP